MTQGLSEGAKRPGIIYRKSTCQSTSVTAWVLWLDGSGKTILIRVLVGQLQPTKGIVSHPPRLSLGYDSQHAVEGLRAPGRKDLSSAALAVLHAEADNDMSEAEFSWFVGFLWFCQVNWHRTSPWQLVGIHWQLTHSVPYSKRGDLESSPPAFLILDEIMTL